jgi:enhancing lycopene biosynthesis protein 2
LEKFIPGSSIAFFKELIFLHALFSGSIVFCNFVLSNSNIKVMKKFAIVLSGSGVYDGSEIHEAVMSMYAVVLAGASYTIFAPDINQHHVINHLNGEEQEESRNVLIESARIARGGIKELGELDVDKFDALLIPGGFGVAKNLCTYAFEGDNFKVNEKVADVVRHMHKSQKPIGGLCIAPVMIAKVLGDIKVTIGQDEGTKKSLEALGATHVNTGHGEVVVDEKNLVFTTPCYMLDASIKDIADGAINIVNAIMESF